MNRREELFCGVLLSLAGPLIVAFGFFTDSVLVSIGLVLLGCVNTLIGFALLVGRETFLGELDDDAEARG